MSRFDPAFPTTLYVLDNRTAKYEPWHQTNGLSKRELFAVAAMQGFSANPHVTYAEASVMDIARMSIAQADALLTRLEE